MALLRTNLLTQMSNAMSGGEASIAGTGQVWQITFDGSADGGSTVAFYLTDATSGLQTLAGAGDASNLVPVFCFTYRGKVYVLSDTRALFSAVDSAFQWNDPEGLGNGFVDMSTETANPEALLAMAPYQGRIAFFARQNVQIWTVNTDPTAWVQEQVLENIGTNAGETVKAKGNLDVLFLSDAGVRSLRARDGSLNAFVDDVGSPVDSLVKTDIQNNLLVGQWIRPPCAVVEPTSGQYWLFLNDKIYVLSYYPSSKVVAWSTYTPTDSGGAAFYPERFFIHKGQVFALYNDALYQYGGDNNSTYDSTVATLEVPWLNLRNPTEEKSAEGIEAAFTGNWTIQTGMDPILGELNTVYGPSTAFTFGKGLIPMSGFGSHFKFKAFTTGSGAAVFSSLSFLYLGGDKK